MEKYYTSDEVAKGKIEGLPKISDSTLRDLRSKRRIKFLKVGRYCYYTKSWIEEYLKGQTVEPKVVH